MRTNRLAGLASAAMITFFAGHASAAPTVGTIPGNKPNEFVTKFFPGKVIEGWYGANLTIGTASSVFVEYFGAEAGFKNEFKIGGCSFKHGGGDTIKNKIPTASLGSEDRVGTCSTSVGPGMLNFEFISSALLGVKNGFNPDGTVLGTLPNFFVTYELDNKPDTYDLDTTLGGGTPGSGSTLWLFYDDSGGGPDDDNHDDMAFRLTFEGGGGPSVFRVPEPSAIALVGVALLGLRLSRRRLARA